MTEMAAENQELEVVEESDFEVELDFETRVSRLMEMIESDPSVRDRMMCEMYIAFTDFERMTRTMALNGGPMQMIKAILKGGG